MVAKADDSSMTLHSFSRLREKVPKAD